MRRRKENERKMLNSVSEKKSKVKKLEIENEMRRKKMEKGKTKRKNYKIALKKSREQNER